MICGLVPEGYAYGSTSAECQPSGPSRHCYAVDLSGPVGVEQYFSDCTGTKFADITSDGVANVYIAETVGTTLRVSERSRLPTFSITTLGFDAVIPTVLAHNPQTGELLLGLVYSEAFTTNGQLFTLPIAPDTQWGAILHLGNGGSGLLATRLGYPIEGSQITTVSAIEADAEGNFYFAGSGRLDDSCEDGLDTGLHFQGVCVDTDLSSRVVSFYGMVRGVINNAVPIPPSPFFRIVTYGDNLAMSTTAGVFIETIAVDRTHTSRAYFGFSLTDGISQLLFRHSTDITTRSFPREARLFPSFLHSA
mmetsp:Transcript_11339/g.46057  ORF Transcript_11339/g.46057 Transcript_11339/m.46057 type:complete len:306 (-) Transcript_11339:241-1158(-)